MPMLRSGERRENYCSRAALGTRLGVPDDFGDQATLADGASWQKSSYSAMNGNCVEIGRLRFDRIGVRDTKDHGGPVLIFTNAEWSVFIDGVKSGQIDNP